MQKKNFFFSFVHSFSSFIFAFFWFRFILFTFSFIFCRVLSFQRATHMETTKWIVIFSVWASKWRMSFSLSIDAAEKKNARNHIREVIAQMLFHLRWRKMGANDSNKSKIVPKMGVFLLRSRFEASIRENGRKIISSFRLIDFQLKISDGIFVVFIVCFH